MMALAPKLGTEQNLTLFPARLHTAPIQLLRSVCTAAAVYILRRRQQESWRARYARAFCPGENKERGDETLLSVRLTPPKVYSSC